MHHSMGPGTEYGEYGIMYRITDEYTVIPIGNYDEDLARAEAHRKD